jgi:methyl-accepting chemotaxis protein
MTRWIRNLNLSTKLVVIMVAGLLPVVTLTALYLMQKQRDITVAERQLAGLHRCENLEAMLLSVGAHEIWSAATAAGEGAGDKLQQASADVAHAMSEQQAIIEDYGASTDEDAQRWNEIRYAWNGAVAAKPTTVADVIRMHSELRQRILEYRDYIATTSYLVLNPNPITYFMVDATVMQVPNYESYVTELRSYAADIAAAGKPSVAALEQINRTEVLAQGALDQIAADMHHATEGAAGDARHLDAEQLLPQVTGAFEDFRGYLQDKVTGGSTDSLDAVLRNSEQLTAAVGSLHDSLRAAVERQLRQSIDRLRATRDRIELLVVLAVLAGVGAMAHVIWTTVRGINEMVAVVARLAEGDYTHQIDVQESNELGHTMQALQAMQTKLSAVLRDVKDSAATVATAAGQINAGTSDLSVRTEQQAANLEETASAMEQMTATVKQNADNAVLASKLAQAARDQAENGGSVVERAVAAMGAIDVSSKRIADIISVIDEIAFQTNLLALNAAVEAARAGDQGRGFAVVASEVRSLAQRSASAAKEIKDLIHDSVSKVGEGGRLVSESGRHLGEIVAAVKKVSDVVGEISNASQEQAASAEEISRAVLQMDRSTQQNASMVEETNAAATSMQDQATRLSELTAFFKLTDPPDSAHRREPRAEREPRPEREARVAEREVRLAESKGRSPLGRRPGRARGASARERTEAAARSTRPPPAAAGDWSEF